MNRLKRGLAIALAAVTVLGAAGCGSKKVSFDDYSTTVVATLGDTDIYLDEANFQARLSQYSSEMYYAMYGYSTDGMWENDLGSSLGLGSGTTLEDYTKQNIMRGIGQTYILKAKAEELGLTLDDDELTKVDDAVADIVNQLDGSEELKAAVGDVSEDRIKEWVTNNALAMKAYEYAVKDVDTEVSDEEAAQRTISYIRVTDDDDAEAAKTLAEELQAKVEAGEDMSTLADEYDNCTYVTNTYGEGDFDNTVGNYGMEMKTGEIGSVYEDGYAWYVVRCDTDFDEEATENEKPTIVEKRKTEQFQTTYKEWADALPEFKVNEKIWDLITFDKTLYVVETTAAEETSAAETNAEETSAAETQAEETSAAETAGN